MIQARVGFLVLVLATAASPFAHGGVRPRAASAPAKPEVDICHFDKKTCQYALLRVTASSWTKTHSRHDKDCCVEDGDVCPSDAPKKCPDSTTINEVLMTCAARTVNTYSNLNSVNVDSLTLNGAYVDGNANMVMASGQDSAVSFFKTATIDVSCGFSASFGFIIKDVGLGTGDGLAFLMQATGPTVVGGYGESLGYISAYAKGKVVAVEIDTDTSPAQGDSATPAVQVTVGYTEKTRCGIADPIGDETKYVWVDYAAKVLSIYYSTDSTKPGSPCTTWSLDLPKYFGTPNLYLGFSAATGAFANNHYIAGVEFTY